MLRPLVINSGYATVNLRRDNKPGNRFTVHKLVTLSFLGPVPEGMVTNHKNGIKTDNRLENLEFCSQSENMVHAIRSGLIPKCKLSEEDVLEIREKFAKGVRVSTLAVRYGISREYVYIIVKRKAWGHVA